MAEDCEWKVLFVTIRTIFRTRGIWSRRISFNVLFFTRTQSPQSHRDWCWPETAEESQKCHKQHKRSRREMDEKCSRVDNFCVHSEWGKRMDEKKLAKLTANCVVGATAIFNSRAFARPQLSETQIRFQIKFRYTRKQQQAKKKDGKGERNRINEKLGFKIFPVLSSTCRLEQQQLRKMKNFFIH